MDTVIYSTEKPYPRGPCTRTRLSVRRYVSVCHVNTVRSVPLSRQERRHTPLQDTCRFRRMDQLQTDFFRPRGYRWSAELRNEPAPPKMSWLPRSLCPMFDCEDRPRTQAVCGRKALLRREWWFGRGTALSAWSLSTI